MDFDPNNNAELEKLWGMTQRGPFKGMQPDQILGEVSDIPLIDGGVTEEQRFGIQLQSFMRGGVYNDKFSAPPPDITERIDNTENRLPGWDVGSDDESVYFFSYSAASQIVGLYADLDVGDATDDEVAYIEQLVFIPGGNRTALSPAMSWREGSTSPANAYIAFRLESADGLAATSWYEHELTDFPAYPGGSTQRIYFMTETSTYAFIRVRFGIKMSGTQSGTGTLHLGDIDWTWMDEPAHFDATFPFFRAGWSGGSAGNTYNMRTYDSTLPLAQSKWTSPGPGICYAISVYSDASPTAGNLKFFPYIDHQAGGNTSLINDLACYIDTTYTRTSVIRDVQPENAIVYDMKPVDRLDIRVTASAGYTSSGTYNIAGSLIVRFFVENDPSDGGSPYTTATG